MRMRGLLAVAALAVSSVAYADDWGCEVLLCISDPRGATTEAECRPPIEKLWKQLRRGKSFPTCAMAGDSSTGQGSYAVMSQQWFRDCPLGTTPTYGLILRRGERMAERFAPNVTDDTGAPGRRACVGEQVGTAQVTLGDNGSATAAVYDAYVVQKPMIHTVIDVYVDGELYGRVE